MSGTKDKTLGLAPTGNQSPRRNAFTVVELLVVMGILSLLFALLTPALKRTLEQGRSTQCKSNLRQLYIANTLYASEHSHYIAAAKDIWGRNSQRWHGTREGETFEGSKDSLHEYLGDTKTVRACASFHPENGFETGCGGYGYNQVGVGSRSYQLGSWRGSEVGMSPSAIAHPAQTIMFADAAFLKGDTLIEYSFVEPVRHVASGAPHEIGSALPSTHFRHNEKANVIWCDGRVTSEIMTFSRGGKFEENNIGWFGDRDNTLFDPN